MKITGEELEQYLEEKRTDIVLAGCYGQGYRAEVRWDAMTGTFQVYDHGQLKLETKFAWRAAEYFSKIQPRVLRAKSAAVHEGP